MNFLKTVTPVPPVVGFPYEKVEILVGKKAECSR